MNPNQHLTELDSVAAIFSIIGNGAPKEDCIRAVAKLTSRTYNAAANWLSFNKFPSNTYLAITTALNARRYTAPPSLWSMVEPANEDSRPGPQGTGEPERVAS